MAGAILLTTKALICAGSVPALSLSAKTWFRMSMYVLRLSAIVAISFLPSSVVIRDFNSSWTFEISALLAFIRARMA